MHIPSAQQAQRAAFWRGSNHTTPRSSADGADASAAAPLGSLAQEEAELRGAISRLEQEEAELRRALDSSPTLAAFREYLDDKAALEEEEAGLLTRLEEAEAVLSEVHASLTEAPADDSGASSDVRPPCILPLRPLPSGAAPRCSSLLTSLAHPARSCCTSGSASLLRYAAPRPLPA